MDTATATPATSVEIKTLPINQLKSNPWNRTVFDPQAMGELIASIKSTGIEEPLIVRKSGEEQYEIVSGNRRWLAALKAGMTEVPCIVRDLPDEDVAAANITLNVQRESLPPLEMARMVNGYIDKFHRTQQEAATKFGKSRVWVTTLLGFLNMDPEALGYVSALTLAWDQLSSLKRLPPEAQRIVAKEVKDGVTRPEKVAKRCNQLRFGKGLATHHPNLPKRGGNGSDGNESVPDPLADLWPALIMRSAASGLGFWGVSYGNQQIPSMKGVSMPAWHFWVCDQGVAPAGHLKKWLLMLAKVLPSTGPSAGFPESKSQNVTTDEEFSLEGKITPEQAKALSEQYEAMHAADTAEIAKSIKEVENQIAKNS